MAGTTLSDPVKVMIGLPWYAGADRDCVAEFLCNEHYLGRLQERLDWIARLKSLGADDKEITAYVSELPKLDQWNDTGWSEVPPELYGTRVQFLMCDETGCSLVALARERITDTTLRVGADYLWMFDADMKFGTDTFLRLFRAKKDIVGALAFTGRLPITPVIYRAESEIRTEGEQKGIHLTYEPVYDYKPNELQKVDAVGSGVVLFSTEVFRKMPKPWFYTPSMGEDIYCCMKAQQYGFEIWVDTRAKALHKPTFHDAWNGEERYLAAREATA